MIWPRVPDTFTRYFVVGYDGDVEEVFDGEDELGLALDMARELGGHVEAIDYVSDGSWRHVPFEEE